MNKVGIFLEPGGNKSFFINGVLKVFHEEKINLDHLIGFSSSSAILFTHLFGCHDYSLDIFRKKLKKNKHNFYLNKKEIFPHNKIYESAITEMFDIHYNSLINIKTSYTILASQTTIKFKKTKGLIITIAIILRFLKINLHPLIKKLLGIKSLYIQSDEIKKMSQQNIIKLIMGSSTLYPFIKLHTLNEKLILEGDLAEANPIELLSKFDKKIFIHITQGKTRIKNNILHIYSSQPIPNNILYYTGDSGIKALHDSGEKEAKNNMTLIKNYIND
ncbi:hypothetical protein K8R66_02950 [bacterium]|nr:hypothetical protein [bacterium]